jgi:diguanylate cyclase (GGDEF)-like protein/PAS domain S-box-containing protein
MKNTEPTESAAQQRMKALLAALLTGAVLPAGAALLADWQTASRTLTHGPLASLIMGWSAVAAILSSLFIMLMRQTAGPETRSIWIAAALAGMGVLDGFNAGGLPQAAAAVWLHSLAALSGGLLLALTLLPERFDKLPVLQWLPCLIAAFCALPGTRLIFFPDQLPAAETLAAARLISIVGGVGFLVAGLHFSWQRRRESDREERLLLSGSSFLFAASAVLFPSAHEWSASWWFWHVLRLGACFSFLCFFLNRAIANIQQLRRNRDELDAARQQLADLIERTPSAVALKDLSGRFVLVNRRFEEIFQVKKEEIVGHSAADILPYISRRMKEVGEQGTEYEESIALAEGTRTFLTSCFPLAAENDASCCVGCIQTDITERRQMEQRLQLDEKIIANTEEGIVVTDAEAIILDVNDAYCQITGYAREELLGKNPKIAKSGRHDRNFYEEMWRQLTETGSWAGEIWDRRKSGEIFEKWLTINAIKDSAGATVNYVGIFTDITEKRNIERRLKNLLFYDPLTKLPNRSLFQERLAQAMLNSESHDLPMALFCIDLDRFKDVNDSLGHQAGDELLIQAAKRIRSGVRKTDVVARLCGDEFTVILSEIKLRDAVGHLARRLIHLLQQPFYISGEEVFIDASIGISMYPDDGRESEVLIKNADTAMHFAKERAHGSYQFFRLQMNERLVQRITLEKHLRHALDNGEFILHYQPKYSLVTEEIVGMEALIRWQHPTEGIISPSEFIPVAEESSVITAIGAWGLKTACRQIKNWERQGLGVHRVAVNLSSRQFQNRDLIGLVQETLNETGLKAEQLDLEITESAVMEHPDQAVELLHELRQIGVRIAIDDFGTGYSSLSYLKKFPVTTLKIDQSFVADLTDNSDGAAIVDSIIQMARSLNLEVVAEGVETREQADFFKERGCQEVQGYYFSRPLPPDQLAERLRRSPLNQSAAFFSASSTGRM